MQTVSFKNENGIRDIASKVFEEEKQRILNNIPDVEIQHVGGTALPGALTKGDLDINVRVDQKEFKSTVKILKELYAVAQPDNWTESFASFKGSSGNIDVGIQLSAVGAPEDKFVILRDTLVGNKDLLEEYNELKRGFEGKSMDEYRKAKAAFCDRVVASK